MDFIISGWWCTEHLACFLAAFQRNSSILADQSSQGILHVGGLLGSGCLELAEPVSEVIGRAKYDRMILRFDHRIVCYGG